MVAKKKGLIRSSDLFPTEQLLELVFSCRLDQIMTVRTKAVE